MANPEEEHGLFADEDGFLDPDSPFFNFGFGAETNVDEYLERVTPTVVVDRQRRLARSAEEARHPPQPYQPPMRFPLLPHQLFNEELQAPVDHMVRATTEIPPDSVDQAHTTEISAPRHLFRLPHEIYNVPLRQQADADEDGSAESEDSVRELTADTVGHLCMVALCILFVLI